jgi:chemotaxis signal transduction protein
MLHLITLLDGQAYAAEVERIVEVLPLVRLERGLGPEHLAMFRRGGQLTPAVDLSRLLLGRSFTPRLSTRILVVRRQDTGEAIGLVAENVTETLRIPAEAFQTMRQSGEPAFLGPAAMLGAGWVRRIELGPLLEAALHDAAEAA